MKKKLLIDGMSCNHCVNHLNTALTEDIKGVEVLGFSDPDVNAGKMSTKGY